MAKVGRPKKKPMLDKSMDELLEENPIVEEVAPEPPKPKKVQIRVEVEQVGYVNLECLAEEVETTFDRLITYGVTRKHDRKRFPPHRIESIVAVS